MNKFFITATGTNIGKTFVTTTLCRELRKTGKKVVALKPIISGYDKSDEQSDTALILQSLELEFNDDNLDKISPWRFKAALSPDMAATREGKKISLNDVVGFCNKQEKLDADIVLVEGVGGICTPLNDKETVLDLMELLTDWKNILVTGSYLGSISHTISAVYALATRGITPHAVIVSESEESTVSVVETISSLLNFLPESVIIGKLSRAQKNSDSELQKITEICL